MGDRRLLIPLGLTSGSLITVREIQQEQEQRKYRTVGAESLLPTLHVLLSEICTHV